MLVPEQLHPYPSPNSILTIPCYKLTVVGLGEGWVHGCSDTDIDQIFKCLLINYKFILTLETSINISLN